MEGNQTSMEQSVVPQRSHATLVSHTHWDRAWYLPFQEYRVRLVRLVDRLIDLLKSRPDFPVFMLDGQLSVIDDYLEARPRRRGDLERLCREGRISVGPWYSLADEFLASPEALIRNLQMGHRAAEPFGGALKAGYVPDGFGHIAQLPQILRGFGIDSAFFWRGVGTEGDRLGTEFEWAAPDGSSVTAILMPFGYHNASNLGYPLPWGDTSQMTFNMDLAVRQIRHAIERLRPLSHTNALLLMNGIDHAEAEPRIPEIVTQGNAALLGIEIRQGTLLDHLTKVRASRATLPAFSGEFRWGRFSHILHGVYATRHYLKQANDAVETLLERYVEPLSAFAWLCGVPLQEGTADLIWTAWRYVLQSHAHDDIYGAGVDQTHRETLFRFDQARQIGEVLERDALRAIARDTDCATLAGVPILVFNPLNVERHDVCIGEIAFDADDPTADAFEVLDENGKVLPHQVLGVEDRLSMEVLKADRVRAVTVAFQARVESCGIAGYGCQRSPANTRSHRAPSDLRVIERGAENEFVRLTIADDGSLTLHDKAAGYTYRGLHCLEDREDIGDEYTSSSFTPPHVVSSDGSQASVELFHEGPIRITYRVTHSLRLPEGLNPQRSARSERTVEVPVISEVSLDRGSPAVSIVTTVDNGARDHLLSAAFEVDIETDVVRVDESFLVAERPIDLPPAPGWMEEPSSLMHQRRFVDISDGTRGLAVLNRGLAAIDVTRGSGTVVLGLPLVRSIGWLSRSDLPNRRDAAGPLVETPQAQCLGVHRFEYALLSHSGDWRSVYWAAYRYAAPLRLWRADTTEGLDLRSVNITGDTAGDAMIPWPRGGPNPARMSFLRLEPPSLVLSAVSRTPDGAGLVVRFYNIESTPADARLISWRPLLEAWRTTMAGERLCPLQVMREHEINLHVRGHEVVTVELVPRFQ